MCIIWTQNYHLCGCIWNIQDLYCEPDELCWGARMLVIHCYLQTCKECWKNGDKRVDEEVASLLAGKEAKEIDRQQRLQEYHAADTTYSVQEQGLTQDEDQSNSDPESDEEFEALHQSRPITPELELNLEKMPRWLFRAEVMGDATRAWEPVTPEQIWKDYRARRGRTDWYMVEGKFLRNSPGLTSVSWFSIGYRMLTMRIY